MRIEPQPGPQTVFMASPADIIFYGGAAGGGKTYGLCMDPLRHYANPKFRSVMFRRLTRELTMSGGLLETARELYMPLNGRFRNSPNARDCTFTSGARYEFHHLQYEDTVYTYQGLQTGYLGFDELTHFLEMQFRYLITRARSTAGIKLRIRGTCNPDPDSWVKQWVLWYLDKETRFADPKKSGVVRFFFIDEQTDLPVWFSSREEIAKKYGEKFARKSKSFTFILSKLSDNKILLEQSPEYESNLAMQDKVTRQRLLEGDWLIKAQPGDYFQRSDFEEVEYYPRIVREVRFWDRAATEHKPGKNDPDYTAGVKMGLTEGGQYVITGLDSMRRKAGVVQNKITNIAKQDNSQRPCKVMSFQDPGSAGKGEAEQFKKVLSMFEVGTVLAASTKGKETHAKAFSAAATNGLVSVWSGIPLEERLLFYRQLEAFPGSNEHDDYVDAASGAYNELAGADTFGII